MLHTINALERSSLLTSISSDFGCKIKGTNDKLYLKENKGIENKIVTDELSGHKDQ